jgi:hypothetical protein
MSTENLRNFIKTDTMGKKNNNKKAQDTSTRQTNLPGVDNSLVIPSHPIIIKENSRHPTVRKDTKKTN